MKANEESWPTLGTTSDGTRYVADSTQMESRLALRIAAHERTGTHLWIVATVYEVDPPSWRPGTQPKLDESNIIAVNGPGCYICEEPYTERLSHRKCPGVPS